VGEQAARFLTKMMAGNPSEKAQTQDDPALDKDNSNGANAMEQMQKVRAQLFA